jgi:hypothetical protein
MRRLVLLGLCLAPLAADGDATVPAPAGDGALRVGEATLAVEQNGRLVPIRGGVATLAPAPFTLRVSLPPGSGRGLWLHAWTDDTHQRRVREGRPLEEAFPREANAMAEYPRNRERNLFLSPDRYSYWYYASPADHRFDRVQPGKSLVRARRTISSWYWVTDTASAAGSLSTVGSVHLVLLQGDGPATALLTLRFTAPAR